MPSIKLLLHTKMFTMTNNNVLEFVLLVEHKTFEKKFVTRIIFTFLTFETLNN